MNAQQEAITWLMAGDPAIRWQTMRNLLDAPAEEWRAEQQRTIESGWGARLLALQDVDLVHERRRKDGLWPVQHKYSGKSLLRHGKNGRPKPLEHAALVGGVNGHPIAARSTNSPD